MIKQQIETMLNIKGKDMPSVEEEFGSGGMTLIQQFEQWEKYINDISIYFYLLLFLLELSQDNAAKKVIGKVMQNLPEDTRYQQFENEHLIHDHGARYSDYTEKLQSLYPECKLYRHYTNILNYTMILLLLMYIHI